VSTHMVGLGGLMGLVSVLQHFYGLNIGGLLVVCMLVSGLVGTARLYLQHHTESQVYAGFMLGYIVTFGGMMVMQ
jgi:membrane-associated phospholipid phosphatase